MMVPIFVFFDASFLLPKTSPHAPPERENSPRPTPRSMRRTPRLSCAQTAEQEARVYGSRYKRWVKSLEDL